MADAADADDLPPSTAIKPAAARSSSRKTAAK
jgi:hypothetical protein